MADALLPFLCSEALFHLHRPRRTTGGHPGRGRKGGGGGMGGGGNRSGDRGRRTARSTFCRWFALRRGRCRLNEGCSLGAGRRGAAIRGRGILVLGEP